MSEDELNRALLEIRSDSQANRRRGVETLRRIAGDESALSRRAEAALRDLAGAAGPRSQSLAPNESVLLDRISAVTSWNSAVLAELARDAPPTPTRLFVPRLAKALSNVLDRLMRLELPATGALARFSTGVSHLAGQPLYAGLAPVARRACDFARDKAIGEAVEKAEARLGRGDAHGAYEMISRHLDENPGAVRLSELKRALESFLDLGIELDRLAGEPVGRSNWIARESQFRAAMAIRNALDARFAAVARAFEGKSADIRASIAAARDADIASAGNLLELGEKLHAGGGDEDAAEYPIGPVLDKWVSDFVAMKSAAAGRPADLQELSEEIRTWAGEQPAIANASASRTADVLDRLAQEWRDIKKGALAATGRHIIVVPQMAADAAKSATLHDRFDELKASAEESRAEAVAIARFRDDVANLPELRAMADELPRIVESARVLRVLRDSFTRRDWPRFFDSAEAAKSETPQILESLREWSAVMSELTAFRDAVRSSESEPVTDTDGLLFWWKQWNEDIAPLARRGALADLPFFSAFVDDAEEKQSGTLILQRALKAEPLGRLAGLASELAPLQRKPAGATGFFEAVTQRLRREHSDQTLLRGDWDATAEAVSRLRAHGDSAYAYRLDLRLILARSEVKGPVEYAAAIEGAWNSIIRELPDLAQDIILRAISQLWRQSPFDVSLIGRLCNLKWPSTPSAIEAERKFLLVCDAGQSTPLVAERVSGAASDLAPAQRLDWAGRLLALRQLWQDIPVRAIWAEMFAAILEQRAANVTTELSRIRVAENIAIADTLALCKRFDSRETAQLRDTERRLDSLVAQYDEIATVMRCLPAAPLELVPAPKLEGVRKLCQAAIRYFELRDGLPNMKAASALRTQYENLLVENRKIREIAEILGTNVPTDGALSGDVSILQRNFDRLDDWRKLLGAVSDVSAGRPVKLWDEMQALITRLAEYWRASRLPADSAMRRAVLQTMWSTLEEALGDRQPPPRDLDLDMIALRCKSLWAAQSQMTQLADFIIARVSGPGMSQDTQLVADFLALVPLNEPPGLRSKLYLRYYLKSRDARNLLDDIRASLPLWLRSF